MGTISTKFRYALSIFCISALPVCSLAQNGNWNPAKSALDKAKKTTGKTTGTLKDWKAHLQEWGLDTSYNHSLSLGGRLNTNGWTGLVIYQKPLRSSSNWRHAKRTPQSQFYQLSFSEVKHEKQIKQQKENEAFPELGPSSPFIYGKINNLYLLQLSYGREQLLLPGVLEGNISLSFRYSGGFSLAMLKPYYLKLIHVDYTPDQVVSLNEEKYSHENSALFLKRENILGAAKWSKGLDEIAYVPGAFVEGSFVIIPSKNKTFIQQITLGGQFSIYTKELMILAERNTYPYTAALFVGLSVGKRWK